jgi:hypothetical protein
MMTNFRAFKKFNQGLPSEIIASTYGLNLAVADRHFPGGGLHAAIVRSLARSRCIPIKEVVESFEVFEVVRRDLRSTTLVDLCCGHGLVGMLMAAFERSVEAVHLCDRKIPDSSVSALEAVATVAPWITDKVHHHVTKLNYVGEQISFTSALATHACGHLTDQSIDLAIEQGCAIAVTPCCYTKRTSKAPTVLQRELGLEIASDTERTVRLHQAGYTVKWKSIPEVITPMIRVIIATR